MSKWCSPFSGDVYHRYFFRLLVFSFGIYLLLIGYAPSPSIADEPEDRRAVYVDSRPSVSLSAIASSNNGGIHATGHKTIDGAKHMYYAMIDKQGNRQTESTIESSGSTSSDLVVHGRNIYVIGHQGDKAVLWKLNLDGGVIWKRSWDEGWRDRGQAVDTDDQGNVYVTGTDGRNWVTAKFTSDGSRLWKDVVPSAVRYDGAFDLEVWNDIVYVTGEYDDDGFRTIRYGRDGSKRWTREFEGPGNDRAHALTVDDTGNVYVTGKSRGKNPHYVRVIKYARNGELRWNKIHQPDQPVANGNPSDIIQTGDQSLVIVGTRQQKSKRIELLLQYDLSGSFIRERVWQYDRSRGYKDLAKQHASDVFVLSGNNTHSWIHELKFGPESFFTIKDDQMFQLEKLNDRLETLEQVIEEEEKRLRSIKKMLDELTD